MSIAMSNTGPMRTLRFQSYGEPADVLRLETCAIPVPIPGTVSVRVHACGLNPADWALCQGLFQSDLPRGIGLDVAGTVTALGEGITGLSIGDAVLGPADYVHFPSAGASDYAVLSQWAPVPPGLDLVQAAALPLVVETAYRYLTFCDLQPGQTILIHAAGTMVGFAAVQIALLKGAKVIATVGETFAAQLRAMGAITTVYGAGMVERVQALMTGLPDIILDSTPHNALSSRTTPSALADLVAIAGGNPQRVMTIGDFAGAAALGVRTGMETVTDIKDVVLRWDVLGEFAQYAAEGRFTIPIARRFALEDWREALDLSLGGRARGKLMLVPDSAPSLPHKA